MQLTALRTMADGARLTRAGEVFEANDVIARDLIKAGCAAPHRAGTTRPAPVAADTEKKAPTPYNKMRGEERKNYRAGR